MSNNVVGVWPTAGNPFDAVEIAVQHWLKMLKMKIFPQQCVKASSHRGFNTTNLKHF
jgi:hypothetical protein